MSENATTAEARTGLKRVLGPLLDVSSAMPYTRGSLLLHKLFSNSAIQRACFRRRELALRQITQQMGSDVDLRQCLINHLACNILMPWRARSLSMCSAETLEAIVTYSNLGGFDDHYRSNQGMVLVTGHFGAPRLVPLLLARKGYRLNFLSPLNYLAKMGAKNLENINVIQLPADDKYRIPQMMHALRLLGAGQTVGVAADGMQGAAGVDYAFCNGNRKFHSGFAELALRSGASIVPVFAAVEADGKILVRFESPLDPGSVELDTQQRVRHILDQYVEILQSRWRSDPGRILWRHLKLFLG